MESDETVLYNCMSRWTSQLPHYVTDLGDVVGSVVGSKLQRFSCEKTSENRVSHHQCPC